MKYIRFAAALTAAVLLLTAVIFGAGYVLMPVREQYGSSWDTFLQEPSDSLDVLYLGSSMVYCDVIPAIIWQKTGLHTYVTAGPEQTIPISYYYISEACRTQTPQAVVLELNGMFFGRYMSYSKVNIGYMPYGRNRVQAALTAAEPEERLGLLLPIYNYHGRIYDALDGAVDGLAVKEFLNKRCAPEPDSLAGYTTLTQYRSQTELTDRDYHTDTESYQYNLRYLRRLSEFCSSRDIALVLYAAPSCARIPQAAMETLQQDLKGIDFDLFFDGNDCDFSQYDPACDWYDYLHFNLFGAVKFSSVMASQLEKLNLIPGQADEQLWQSRLSSLEEILSVSQPEPAE